jgi:3-methyladenine DNA glycosylase/8-oxoguanine DNA glycosylase
MNRLTALESDEEVKVLKLLTSVHGVGPKTARKVE